MFYKVIVALRHLDPTPALESIYMTNYYGICNTLCSSGKGKTHIYRNM